MAIAAAIPVAGLIGWLISGPVDALEAALLGGAITGAGFVAVQWWAAEGFGKATAWIGISAVGYAGLGPAPHIPTPPSTPSRGRHRSSRQTRFWRHPLNATREPVVNRKDPLGALAPDLAVLSRPDRAVRKEVPQRGVIRDVTRPHHANMGSWLRRARRTSVFGAPGDRQHAT